MGLTKKMLFCLACVGLLAGCTGASHQVTGRKVTTLSLARKQYLAGLVALKEGDYPKATELLRQVARGPSYIVYTPLAKLRLADSLFFQERYEEAREAYRGFIETEAGDPNLHYAQFMYAQSTVKSLPGEFFLSPPADRKDQRRIRAALGALTRFLSRFPDSPFVVEALQMDEELVQTATSYEMEVAHFYMTRDKPKGAVMRLKRLMQEIPQAARREETWYALAQAQAEQGDGDGLARTCEQYRDRFRGGRLADDMEELCASKSQGD